MAEYRSLIFVTALLLAAFFVFEFLTTAGGRRADKLLLCLRRREEDFQFVEALMGKGLAPKMKVRASS
jgi:hypothetical protein